MVGVKKCPSRRRVPIDSNEWNTRVPTITQQAEKLDHLSPGDANIDVQIVYISPWVVTGGCGSF